MRLNDVGITAIANAIKDSWQYLRLADSATNTYSGTTYSSTIKTITLESTTVTDNEITLVFVLGVLDGNGKTINMSGLSTTLE